MIDEEKLKALPSLPGVYLMKGDGGEVLYIGKAKNIRVRVRSYFHGRSDDRYTVRFLVAKVAGLDYIVTANEKEAFILEDTLLKRYKPRYNIRLKDDKTYVSIMLTLSDTFPRILVTRRVKSDGSRYFGPYASAHKVRETIKFIRRLFPLCTCGKTEFNNRVRPCLDYQLGICAAPCVGYMSEERYGELVDAVTLFLEGRNRRLMTILKGRMREASKEMAFESAAAIRDQITALEETLSEQKVVSHKRADRDFIAVAEGGRRVLVKVMLVRDGRVVGGRDFPFKGLEIPLEELLSSFLSQYYRRDSFVPNEVIVPHTPEGREVIEEWLSDRKGRRVRVLIPRRGERVRLLAMATANAEESLRKVSGGEAETSALLLEVLQKRLRLGSLPRVIEAFDISNTSGKLAVGAMVTFVEGEPDKERYRRFRIRMSDGPDDYGMMYEVMSRRYRREGGGAGSDCGMPDLILVDGGKGQLNVALKVLDELGIDGVEVAALAKERSNTSAGGEGAGKGAGKGKGERIFLPKVKDPVLLQEGSKPDLLLRRIRDEVHRFAISYHKRLRKRGIASVLDEIHGIGPMRRRALLTRFGDIKRMRSVSLKELLTVEGINEKIAMAIKEGLERTSSPS
ncbi:MAG: excinuclease ABC subunit UvrC [Deltaproteobacteria bacterium]|nr:excinuclease ABC subunit UvrC [Deltaproteobacteria bacterium]